MHIAWTVLLGDLTGGSPILGYHLQFDKGTNGATWFDIVETTESSYMFSDGIVAGTLYQIRIRARNKYGYGTWSSILSTKAANVPGKPVAPSTSISNTNVMISWIKPNEGSASITEYSIEILEDNSLTTFHTVIPECDGSLSTIVSTLQCFIQSTILMASPFNLD